MLKKFFKNFCLFGIIGFSLSVLVVKKDYPMLIIMGVIIFLLSIFSLISFLLRRKKSTLAIELTQRTTTWWWMCSIFMLALSTHRLVSFTFLSFLSFFALKEFFKIAEKPKNNFRNIDLSDFFYGFVIIFSAYLAYIQWYGLYVIWVPVYIFLIIPIIFVLQNRSKDVIRSLGVIAIGLIFFVYNLGYSFFLINLNAIALLYCFFLTEIRDLLVYWIGKALALSYRKWPKSICLKFLNRVIAPKISPKKTWGAGIFAALFLVAISIAFIIMMPKFYVIRSSISIYTIAAILGLAIGFLGLMGDLVFSMVKRDLDLKDSGKILPGHGGIIDRVDSLIFTVPITFHLIRWFFAYAE